MTTPVGSIKLDLTIDGLGLPAELLRSIHAAMAPAVADMQRELGRVERSYASLGRAAEVSATQQVTALGRVVSQLHDVRDAALGAQAAIRGMNNAQNRSGQRGGRGSLGNGSGNRINYDYRTINNYRNTVNNKNDYRTDNRTINNYTYNYDNRVHNGNGGFGGGNGGNNNRNGGFGGGGGGRGGFLTSPLGLNGLALGASALPAATTAVTNLVGAIQQLAQAGLVLPGVFAGAASSIGVAVLGFQGMSDAVTALNEAAASGDPKDLEKVAAVLKDMAPAAVEVARSVSKLTSPGGALKELQKNTAQRIFAGVASDFDAFAAKTVPRVEAGFGGIADAWNGTLKEILRVGGSDSTGTFLDRIFGNTAEGQKRASAAIDPLVKGFGQLAAVGSDFLPRLGDALTDVAKRFSDFVQRNSDNGNLFRWIDEGLNGLRALGNTFINIGGIITGITKAAGALTGSLSGDGGILGGLEEMTGKWSDFINSAEGQKKLTDFFAEGKRKLDEWIVVLKDIARIAGDVLKGFQQFGDFILPIIGGIASGLNGLGGDNGVIAGVVTAFLGFKTIGALIGGVSTALGGLGGAAAVGATGITAALRKIVLPAGLAALLFSQTGNLQSPTASTGDNLTGLGLNVGGGAAAGFVVGGPIGAAIGAVIGAGVTLFQSARQQLEDGKAEFEAAWERGRSREPGSPGTPEAQQEAIPSLKGVLMPSTFNPDGTPKPTVGQDIAAKIAAGQLPGWTIGPGGVITGPNGAVIPGIAAPSSTPPMTPAATLPQGPGLPNTWNVPPLPDLGQELKDKTGAAITEIQTQLAQGFNGQITITDPTPEILERLRTLGVKITEMPDGSFTINPVGLKEAVDKATVLNQQISAFAGKRYTATLEVQQSGSVPQVPGFRPTPGRATGGPIIGPGGPTADLVPFMGSNGEWVLTAAEVAALGGYPGVRALTGRLRGFADGGPLDGSVLTGALSGDPVLALLTQIRDLLAGKGGVGSNPLAATAANTGASADAVTAASKTAGAEIGPFGTPLKKRGDPGYEMAAAAVSALGGDPEKFLGADPSTYFAPGGAGFTSAGGVTGAVGGVDTSSVAAALVAFAKSGDTTALSGTGLTPGDSVVKAIVAARNKKKGGLDDDTIADLVQQVVGDGGFSGVLDSSNSSLVSSLQTYRNKLLKGTSGFAQTAGATGVPLTPLGANANALIAFAQQSNGGQYAAASDLANGLADCSGAVSDLVELVTKGQTSPERLFTTLNEADVLKSLGAVEGLVPGALQIGVSPTHTAATLPNGVNFESGGSGGGVVYGGGVGAADKQFTQRFSLPVDGSGTLLASAGGAANPLTGGGYSGGPVPVYIVSGPGSGGFPSNLVTDPLGAGIGAAGQAGTDVATDVARGFTSALTDADKKRAPDAQLNDLIAQRNPLAVANMLGFKVQDFTRGPAGEDAMMNAGPGFDASGRLFSDTASITDRTFTDLTAQIQAMKDQLTDVTEQVVQKLESDALEPVLKAGVQSALEELKGTVVASLGQELGQGAAGPIAAAVKEGISNATINVQGGQSGGQAGFTNALGGLAGSLFATGGPVFGGTLGVDSVPIMAQHGEFVLDTGDVRRMGGVVGVERFRRALEAGRVRGFATGGGVIGNDTVGADFFGVSKVPIIGAIVNLLVKVLLKVIGVEIEVRDTLDEMSDEVRRFRGDFQKFDATGRLASDTSGLLDRTSSSEQTVADERIRILKIVIEALVKYIIEKVIVPITKAVANAAIQAGASAAGAAVNTQAPGAGGIVSSLISSAGQAGVEVAAEVGTDFALALSSTLIQAIAEGGQSLFPDLVTSLFGGNLLARLFDPAGGALGDVLGGLFQNVLGGAFTDFLGGDLFSSLLGGTGGALGGGLFSAIAGIFTTLIGGAALGGGFGGLGGGLFDDGGYADGVGLLPKAVKDPELVLSPRESKDFPRMAAAVEALAKGNTGTSQQFGDVHLHGTQIATPRQFRDQLLALID